MIEDSLLQVRQRMEMSARSVGRNPDPIKLVAVTKTLDAEAVMAAYLSGQREFGENRIQEWLEKSPHLPADCAWHLIGQLQSNKVKYLNSSIALIHSLDRMNLLRELEHQGERMNLIWPTLVQVNIARDPNKAGLEKEDVEDFLGEVARCQHVRVKGLMTIGKLGATEEETRGFFRSLRDLKECLRAKTIPNVTLDELSMGMSRDFEIAIQEGATIVRVGSQIFGVRKNKKALV